MIWFTGDNHFGHANIIELCKRPFASTEEMDAEMINRWNSVVNDGDVVYHVGDFCLKNRHYALSVFRKLKGMIYILDCSMHHDRWMRNKEDVLEVYTASSDTVKVTKQIIEITVKNQIFILSHFPLFAWPKAYYGSIHIHGHVHGSPIFTENGFPAVDVGVDCNNFTPVSAYEIIERVKGRGA